MMYDVARPFVAEGYVAVSPRSPIPDPPPSREIEILRIKKHHRQLLHTPRDILPAVVHPPPLPPRKKSRGTILRTPRIEISTTPA